MGVNDTDETREDAHDTATDDEHARLLERREGKQMAVRDAVGLPGESRFAVPGSCRHLQTPLAAAPGMDALS